MSTQPYKVTTPSTLSGRGNITIKRRGAGPFKGRITVRRDEHDELGGLFINECLAILKTYTESQASKQQRLNTLAIAWLQYANHKCDATRNNLSAALRDAHEANSTPHYATDNEQYRAKIAAMLD